MMSRALFLDRDGVINIEKDYVYQIEDFEFIDGVIETLKFFQDAGYLLIIITNQAGIGRGYYTEEQYHKLNEWMVNYFFEREIQITKVYYCPYHPEHGVGIYKKESIDRKPNPGMILKAVEEFNIDLIQSILIGDKESDIDAGISAGIIDTVLVHSKYSTDKARIKARYAIDSVKELTVIIQEDGR